MSWAKGIVIAEPAPKAAYLARYLAPRWNGLLSLRSEDGIGFVPTVVAAVIVATVLFGAGGGGAAVLAVKISGQPCLVWSWLGFDAFLALCLSVSYWLIGRYGLRFYGEDPTANPLWRTVTVGNAAWRSLPSRQRNHQRPRLRALNSTARLLQTDPEDDGSWKALTAHADVLRCLSTAVLTDSSSELLWPTVTLPTLSPESCFAVPHARGRALNAGQIGSLESVQATTAPISSRGDGDDAGRSLSGLSGRLMAGEEPGREVGDRHADRHAAAT